MSLSVIGWKKRPDQGVRGRIPQRIPSVRKIGDFSVRFPASRRPVLVF